METLNIKVTGRVQGVYFRAHTQKTAKRIGATGSVRNKSDGSVEILAQGKKAALDKLVQWCHQGSPASKVEDVIVNNFDTDEIFEDFVVRY